MGKTMILTPKPKGTMVLTRPMRSAPRAPTNTQPVMIITPRPTVPFTKASFIA